MKISNLGGMPSSSWAGCFAGDMPTSADRRSHAADSHRARPPKKTWRPVFRCTLNDRLDRIEALVVGGSAGAVETAYQYNGTGRLVEVDYPSPDVRLRMFASSGNDYDAFDRFGRTVRQQWVDYTGAPDTRDQVDYTYDYAGNRLTRDVSSTTTYDQTYTYDGLHRLQTVDETTAANDRYWELDQ